jgi:putative aldouronate transport system permease protein
MIQITKRKPAQFQAKPVPAAVPANDAEKVSYQKARRKARFKRDLGANITLTLMALPALLHILLFRYFTLPFLVVAFKSYRNADGVWGSKWIGWANFKFLFGVSDKGWEITRNAILYNLVFIILGTSFALLVAVLLNEAYRYFVSRYYQTAFFIPNMISWVVVAFVVYAFLQTNNGMLNSIRETFGLKPVNWYTNKEAWPIIIVVVNLWRGVGVSSVIYLAGIMRINTEYFEAAAIDGANKLQITRFITLPQLVPLITILTLLAIGNIFFSDFGLFYQVPRQDLNPTLIATTDTIDTFVFRSLRLLNKTEMAAAAGLYQSVVGFILVIAANWVVRKVDPDRALF